MLRFKIAIHRSTPIRVIVPPETVTDTAVRPGCAVHRDRVYTPSRLATCQLPLASQGTCSHLAASCPRHLPPHHSPLRVAVARRPVVCATFLLHPYMRVLGSAYASQLLLIARPAQSCGVDGRRRLTPANRPARAVVRPRRPRGAGAALEFALGEPEPAAGCCPWLKLPVSIDCAHSAVTRTTWSMSGLLVGSESQHASTAKRGGRGVVSDSVGRCGTRPGLGVGLAGTHSAAGRP